MSNFPTVRPKLRQLIIEALEAPYMSESCQDSIQTGNHYQSVLLGEERTRGFRTSRDAFLDRIDFAGRAVLDLGSNLGELSREAQRRGAAVVDGYEYDGYFVEVANMINAYNGTARVSFHERDITNRASYAGCYDIVMAFAVWTYIERVLDRLSEITSEILVLETHVLDGNTSVYVDKVSAHFPHHVDLGRSDWGGTFPDDYKRAVLVFAKDPAILRRCVLVSAHESVA